MIMKVHYQNYLQNKNKYINYFIKPNIGCLFEKVKKIRTFINLIKVDGKIDDREIELLENLMDKFELDSNDKIELYNTPKGTVN